MLPLDQWKDQTLFLSQIPQRALQKSVFPLGDILKKDVKKIAESIGLDRIAKKKEVSNEKQVAMAYEINWSYVRKLQIMLDLQ